MKHFKLKILVRILILVVVNNTVCFRLGVASFESSGELFHASFKTIALFGLSSGGQLPTLNKSDSKKLSLLLHFRWFVDIRSVLSYQWTKIRRSRKSFHWLLKVNASLNIWLQNLSLWIFQSKINVSCSFTKYNKRTKYVSKKLQIANYINGISKMYASVSLRNDPCWWQCLVFIHISFLSITFFISKSNLCMCAQLFITTYIFIMHNNLTYIWLVSQNCTTREQKEKLQSKATGLNRKTDKYGGKIAKKCL